MERRQQPENKKTRNIDRRQQPKTKKTRSMDRRLQRIKGGVGCRGQRAGEVTVLPRAVYK